MNNISIIIPTLNAQAYIYQCLLSIFSQDYPKHLVEVIVADGGSTDKTLEICSQFQVKVIQNRLKTAEAGKAIGLRVSKGDLIAFIDSDNILPVSNWLSSMTEPFTDDSIIGAEPMYFHYDKHDSLLTRYFALLGMGDPLCLYIGNYDHFCHITQRWTGLQLDATVTDQYTKFLLELHNLPTLGANGALLRRSVLEEILPLEYYFDIDVLANIATRKHRYFAKVHTSIKHIYATTWIGFIKKQNRRVVDYLYYSKQTHRSYNWSGFSKRHIISFVLQVCTLLPLFIHSVLGFSRVRDKAWIAHPLACLLTLGIYGRAVIRHVFIGSLQPADRTNW